MFGVTLAEMVDEVMARQCYVSDCNHCSQRECERCELKGCKSHITRCLRCKQYLCEPCDAAHESECRYRDSQSLYPSEREQGLVK